MAFILPSLTNFLHPCAKNNHNHEEMATVEDVVIVGAGLAGLATAVGLHRMGIKSLVLETSNELRASGFALTTWGNAWRAMDALGVGNSLRNQSPCLVRQTATSVSSGGLTSEISLTTQGECGKHEVRCVKRNLLLETLAKELPQGTIRYSSKLVSIDEEADEVKRLHLIDGSVLKTKVLVGCDGVNSVVAKWLGLKKPSFSGRSACRGFAMYPNGHGFKPDFAQFFGKGFRFGFLPCDEKSLYWFFTWTPTAQENDVGDDAIKMKQFVLNKMRVPNVPEDVVDMIEKSKIGSVVSSPLRYRWPFELFWGNISKGNVCVAGDALHPMTPDLGQGGCSALEDGVVLARCLGEALSGGGIDGQNDTIKNALAKYAEERKWRSFQLVATSYVLGFIQESDRWLLNFLRDKCLSEIMAKQYLKKADFDCGKI